MASNFLGINRGQFKTGDVATGSSTQATDFELRIDTGKASTKQDVVLAAEILLQFIISNYIPSGNPGVNQPPL